MSILMDILIGAGVVGMFYIIYEAIRHIVSKEIVKALNSSCKNEDFRPVVEKIENLNRQEMDTRYRVVILENSSHALEERLDSIDKFYRDAIAHITKELTEHKTTITEFIDTMSIKVDTEEEPFFDDEG